MKRLNLSLVAIAICILSDGNAFGQTPQGSESQHGVGQQNGTHQQTQLNSCQSCNKGGGHQFATSCYDSRCSRGGSVWTQPLCPNSCFAKCGATKASWDAGWNPPTHMPVNYDGAWYGSYLPQHAYGTPGGGFIAIYPTVYQPTDTTQLGYYYTKVPTWQSRSDMIPGVPYPSNYHARVCPQGGAGCHSFHGATYGPVNYRLAPASCQNCNSGHYSALPQHSSPKGHQVVRTAQPQRKGLLDGFRLASMTEVFD